MTEFGALDGAGVEFGGGGEGLLGGGGKPNFAPVTSSAGAFYMKKVLSEVSIYDLYRKTLESADNGKLYVIKSVFSIDSGGLGATFLSYHLFNVK